jgi:hypothetical protein
MAAISSAVTPGISRYEANGDCNCGSTGGIGLLQPEINDPEARMANVMANVEADNTLIDSMKFRSRIFSLLDLVQLKRDHTSLHL